MSHFNSSTISDGTVYQEQQRHLLLTQASTDPIGLVSLGQTHIFVLAKVFESFLTQPSPFIWPWDMCKRHIGLCSIGAFYNNHFNMTRFVYKIFLSAL